jgi:hypothetical protein
MKRSDVIYRLIAKNNIIVHNDHDGLVNNNCGRNVVLDPY